MNKPCTNNKAMNKSQKNQIDSKHADEVYVKKKKINNNSTK